MRQHQQDIMEIGGRAAVWLRDENHLAFWTLHDNFWMAFQVRLQPFSKQRTP